jgi:alanyl-tRNA synthetase
LGFNGPFLSEIARVIIEIMGDHYTELRQREDFITTSIEQEEARFGQTLTNGMAMLDEVIAGLKARGENTIPGDEAFRLYDTHGFPLDLTQDIARDNDMGVDLAGFQAAMTDQRERARAAAQFGPASAEGAQVYAELLLQLKALGVVGPEGVVHDYLNERPRPTTVAALVRNGMVVPALQAGDAVEVVLPETPFYLESGGQVADIGRIISTAGPDHAWTIDVSDVRQPAPGLIVHSGRVLNGSPTTGDAAEVRIDRSRRMDIRRNHTATHLLDHELRELLGKHVQQAGSVVAPDRLRFDFTQPTALTQEQLDAVERSINEAILEDAPVTADHTTYRNAVAEGAIALFTEKYGDEVRVVKIGDRGREYSKELCGGTHVDHTGQIGLFRILSEESVGAGVRRIEALTGRAALDLVRRRLNLLDRTAEQLRVGSEQLDAAVVSLQEARQSAHKENARLKEQIALGQSERLLSQAVQVDGVAVLAASVPDTDTETLRDMTDHLRERLGSSVILLATSVEGKPQLIAAATEDLTRRGVHAGELAKTVARTLGGGGGGKPTLGQAGGRDLSKLPEALAQVPDLVRKQMVR